MTNILLIDDEMLVRGTLGLMLTQAGHSVTFAADGEEGLRKVHAMQPDLVITDLVMPHQEGIETIIAIRKAKYAMPILAISGGSRGGFDYLRTAIEFGATKILYKPFGRAVFLQMVDDCLMTRNG